MKRKFKWDSWDFDLEGEAYIIAKDECPEKEKVPDYIIKVDGLHPDCKEGMIVEEGWCKYQVRTDWEERYGEPLGSYVVETNEPFTKWPNGKRKPGWFPVWIVRKGAWY